MITMFYGVENHIVTCLWSVIKIISYSYCFFRAQMTFVRKHFNATTVMVIFTTANVLVCLCELAEILLWKKFVVRINVLFKIDITGSDCINSFWFSQRKAVFYKVCSNIHKYSSQWYLYKRHVYDPTSFWRLTYLCEIRYLIIVTQTHIIYCGLLFWFFFCFLYLCI